MSSPVISPSVMEIVVDLVNSIHHGSLTLTVQDGRLLQLERNDKIRLDAIRKGGAANKSLGSDQVKRLQNRLQEELASLQFGQVVLQVKDGVIAQLERTEKQRYSGLEGIYGDGI